MIADLTAIAAARTIERRNIVKRKPKTSGAAPKKTSKQKAAIERARKAYNRGVLSRGEAAPRDKEGRLPLPYTHEIIDGRIVRRRFSMVQTPPGST